MHVAPTPHVPWPLQWLGHAALTPARTRRAEQSRTTNTALRRDIAISCVCTARWPTTDQITRAGQVRPSTERGLLSSSCTREPKRLEGAGVPEVLCSPHQPPLRQAWNVGIMAEVGYPSLACSARCAVEIFIYLVLPLP